MFQITLKVWGRKLREFMAEDPFLNEFDVQVGMAVAGHWKRGSL